MKIKRIPLPLIILVFALIAGQLGAIRFPIGVIYLHDLALIPLTVIFLLNRKNWNNSFSFQKPLVFFLAALIVSLFVNIRTLSYVQVGWAFLYILRIAWYLQLYYIVRCIYRADEWRMIIRSTSFLFAVFGLLQMILYPDLRNLFYLGWDPHYYRLFSTLLDPNYLGIILVIGFLLHSMTDSKGKNPMLRNIQIVVFVVSILLTFSRSTYVSLLTAFVFLAIRMGKIRQLILLTGAIIIFGLIPKPNILGFNLLRTDTVVSRLENWVSAGQLFFSSPIFGVGFNTLPVRAATTLSDIPNRAAGGIDNGYLFLFSTSGIVGMGTFLYLVYAVHKKFRVTSKSRGLDTQSVYGAALIAVLTHTLFINSLFYPWVVIFVAMLLGLIERDAAEDMNRRLRRIPDGNRFRR